MRFLHRCLGIVFVLAIGASWAAAQDPAQTLKVAGQDAEQALKASKPVTLTATIEAIDQTNRIVVLKGPKGNLAEYMSPDRQAVQRG